MTTRPQAGEGCRLFALAALAVLFWLAFFTAPARPDTPPEVGNCYGLEVVETFGGEPEVGWPGTSAGWWIFLCPAGERPKLEDDAPSELRDLLEEMAASGPEHTRWDAQQLAALSSGSLRSGLCAAVTVVRSVSPADPDDGRSRSAGEISRWWCERVAGVPYSARTRRCDWQAPPLAARPSRVRSFIRALDLPPAELKIWHDRLKPLAGSLCPRSTHD